MAHKMYIETYVKNYNTIHIPSGDTVFKRIYKAAVNDGIHILSILIDCTVKMAIELNAFNNPVNIAIDEHDYPYLIDAPFHKFRGTEI